MTAMCLRLRAVSRVMRMLYKRKVTLHVVVCKPASFYLHVVVSFLFYILFAMIEIALQITTRPIFEPWLKVCEPWQRNTPLYSCSCIFFVLYTPFHYYSRVACHNSSEVRNATHRVWALTDEHTATRLTVRSRKFKAHNNICAIFRRIHCYM